MEEVGSKVLLTFQEPATKKTNKSKDAYLGIHNELESPVLLFLKLDDIRNGYDNIYFFAYSMGKKKVVLWGLYNKPQNTFKLENACKYNVRILSSMLRQWDDNGYSYISNSVKDRITTKMDDYLDIKSNTPHITSYEMYRKYKYLVSFYNDRIDIYELENGTYPGIIDDFVNDFMLKYDIIILEENIDLFYDYIDVLEDETIKYEEKMTRNDMKSGINPKDISDVMLINKEFHKYISTLDVINNDENLYNCPSKEVCQNNKFDDLCQIYVFGLEEFLSTSDSRYYL
ncbi:Hypothetical protein ORPV_159 [Orpheovirus IHUMI-LCC2]|uniref:Uncharacterized protein n=1 Tax=Orpheovirus IHUMI-LCC2 TaxID=2023057 RepID=A0A2I2L3G1_9VIRU|nr:Hypothetical protein ORPV_159 [Orpheovirus IHUMI-LCC2]SNW62063.1 Hypothetical protein ORPV_159 [Orpheovirus IHUMI-LCC2]